MWQMTWHLGLRGGEMWLDMGDIEDF